LIGFSQAQASLRDSDPAKAFLRARPDQMELFDR
jgi:hypothetical protein